MGIEVCHDGVRAASAINEAERRDIADAKRWREIRGLAHFSGYIDGENRFTIRVPDHVMRQDFTNAVDEFISPTKRPLDWDDVGRAVDNENIEVLRAYIEQEDLKE